VEEQGEGGSAAETLGREEAGTQRGAAAVQGVAASAVGIEAYDGLYQYVVCSECVRGNAGVLHCSQCSSHPFHRARVGKTNFMHKCPQCAGNTVMPWAASEPCAPISTCAAPLTIDLKADPP